MTTLTTTAETEMKRDIEKSEDLLRKIEAQARKIGAKVRDWFQVEPHTMKPTSYFEESYFRDGFCGRLMVAAYAVVIAASSGYPNSYASERVNPGPGYRPMVQMVFTYLRDRSYKCAVDITSDQDDIPKTEFRGAHDCFAGGAAPSKVLVLLDLDGMPDMTEVKNVFVHAQAPGERSRSYRVETVVSQATPTDKLSHLELTFALENTAFITERFVRGDRFELEAILELWNRDGFLGYAAVNVPVVLL